MSNSSPPHDENGTLICANAPQRRLPQMFVMLSDRRERKPALRNRRASSERSERHAVASLRFARFLGRCAPSE